MASLLVPLVYLVFYSWFLYHVFLYSPLEALIGIGMNLSGIPLLLAGVVPGLLEPRAFVATFLLVFAGLLAASLPRLRKRATTLH